MLTSPTRLHYLTIASSLVLTLTGCNYIKQLTGSPSTTPSNQPATNPTQQATANPAPKGPMNGTWKLAFSFKPDDQTPEQVMSSHIELTQSGAKFSGKGTDDHNGKPFLIENGSVRNDAVIFYKRYDQPDNPNQPPVEYSGNLDLNEPPYMKGNYAISFNGREVTGNWEAEKEPSAQDQQAQQQPPPQPPPPQNRPDKPPDLSGKWNMGFEFQFKTMHSTMFLEQSGGNITGHGVDENTKETFQIEKGWYKYPKLTLIRKYPAIKAKKGSKPERRMTFKADVSWVTEPDYQGPYLSGKTEGGGNWEAQLVR